MTNFRSLIRLDPTLTVDLITEQFPSKLQEFVDSINGHIEEQYLYLDTFLKVQHVKIQSCIESYLMSNTDIDKAMTYMKL
jgi:hypothetical protein